MPKSRTRIKTKYAGVYYRINKNTVKVFYITYREDHKTKELKVGTFDEGMRVEEANTIRLSIVSSLRLGTDAPHILKSTHLHEKVTFDSMAELYFESKELHNMTNKQSRGKYASQLSPYIGHKNLHGITKKDIIKIQIAMSETKAPKTVNQYVQFIRAVYYYAIEEEIYIGINPAKGIKEIKVDNRRERFLTQKEIKQLLSRVVNDHQLYLFTLIALTTGARSGSVLNVRKKDIDIAHTLLTLTDFKNKSTYGAFFSGKLIGILTHEIEHLKKNDLLLTMSSRTLRRKMKKILDTLFNQGLAKDDRKNRAVIHTLRHTFASHLAINGTSIFIIQKLLNHKDIKQTMRYAKLSPDSGRDDVNQIMASFF